MKEVLVPAERIERSILLIRGQKVMMDADLARIYQVPTKRLNEQVKRNRHRFPEDFVFQLKAEERAEVVANCDHLRSLKSIRRTIVLQRGHAWCGEKGGARQ